MLTLSLTHVSHSLNYRASTRPSGTVPVLSARRWQWDMEGHGGSGVLRASPPHWQSFFSLGTDQHYTYLFTSHPLHHSRDLGPLCSGGCRRHRSRDCAAFGGLETFGEIGEMGKIVNREMGKIGNCI